MKKITKESVITGILVILWMVVIFHFSNQPGVTSGELSSGVCDGLIAKVNQAFSLDWSSQMQQKIAQMIEFPVRKIAHMSEYALLALLLLMHLRAGKKSKGTRKNDVLAFLFTVVYAATDEFHQFFIPGRSAQVRDVLIDALGAILGLLLCYLTCEKWKNPLK